MNVRALPAILIFSITSFFAVGQTNTPGSFVQLVNLPGTAAKLPSVRGVALDASGNVFFISGGSSGAFDTGYSVLRLDAATGILTSVAGNGTPGYSGDNGPATSAQLGGATGVAADRVGNLYIADTNNGVVRKVSNGVITTFAGGGFSNPDCDNCPATSANISDIAAITVDSAGSLYIVEGGLVRKVTNGVITGLAGFGYFTDGVNTPASVAVDSGGALYIAGPACSCIFKVSNGATTTVAGTGVLGFSGDNGPATSAQLTAPRGVAVDDAGNLYIADTGNQRIRKVSNGVITTVAGGGPPGGMGDNGPAISAQLYFPFGVDLDAAGNLYIADTLDQRIRRVANGVITTIAGGGSTPVLTVKSAGAFAATASMSNPRIGHTATLLDNGKVLIAGGFEYPNVLVLGGSEYPSTGSTAISTSELYDPATSEFVPTGSMNPALGFTTAVLLADGRVLIVGAPAPYRYQSPASAQLYDPSTGAFTSAGNLLKISRVVTATLLNNGKVLITGGSVDGPYLPPDYVAELYDPSTGLFTAAGKMSGGHYTPGAALLPDGNVLIADGECFYLGSGNELYDPFTDMFSSAPGVLCTFSSDTLIPLPNGNVLIIGVSNAADEYNPANGTNLLSGNVYQVDQREILLPDKTVLITGGDPCVETDDGCSYSSVADAYLRDPSTGSFGFAGSMTTSRSLHQTTLLPDGTVLISGGDPLGSAEIYTPQFLVAAPALFSLSGDGTGQGAIWHADTGKIVSSGNTAIAGDVLSLYTTGLIEGGAIPPLVAVGGKLSEILYFGDAPGYPGYFQVNFRVPSGVAPGSAISVRLTYLSRPSNAVTIGVQQ